MITTNRIARLILTGTLSLIFLVGCKQDRGTSAKTSPTQERATVERATAPENIRTTRDIEVAPEESVEEELSYSPPQFETEFDYVNLPPPSDNDDEPLPFNEDFTDTPPPAPPEVES